jgi:far upstream element-binding protein
MQALVNEGNASSEEEGAVSSRKRKAEDGEGPATAVEVQKMMKAAETSEVLEVPNEKVGLVIGKGGVQIGMIQYTSGAKIQVGKEPHAETGLRSITISARNAEQVELAIHLIGRKIEESSALNPKFDLQIELSEEEAGWIIGKGGAAIKQLQAGSGALVDVASKAAADPSNEASKAAVPSKRQVVISGVFQQTRRCQLMIAQLIAQRQQGGAGGAGAGALSLCNTTPSYTSNCAKLMVPDEAVALIIGKHGDNIKKVQEDSGAAVQVSEECTFGKDGQFNMREITLRGTHAEMQKAAHGVNMLLKEHYANMGVKGVSAAKPVIAHGPALPPVPSRNKVMHQKGAMSSCVKLSSESVGKIIGRKGATIQQIQQQSGAHIDIQKDREPGKPVTVTITGTTEQLALCNKLVLEKLRGK